MDSTATAVFAEAPNLVPGARNWAKVKILVGEAVAFEGTYAVGIKKAAVNMTDQNSEKRRQPPAAAKPLRYS